MLKILLKALKLPDDVLINAAEVKRESRRRRRSKLSSAQASDLETENQAFEA